MRRLLGFVLQADRANEFTERMPLQSAKCLGFLSFERSVNVGQEADRMYFDYPQSL